MTRRQRRPSAPPDGRDEPPRQGGELREIKGIGPAYAALLSQIGVRTAADLAQHDPDSLAQALMEHAATTAPRRVDAEGWIDRARELTGGATEWSQVAGFSLFVDRQAEGPGQRWRLRAHHAESGDELETDGLDMAEPLGWMAERAGVSPEHGGAANGSTVTLEVAEVAVSEEDGEGGRRLAVEVAFALAGPGAEGLAAARSPFMVTARAVDASGRASAELTARGELDPERLDYRIHGVMAIPPVGRHELRAGVVVAAVSAEGTGPAVEVVL